MSVNLPKLQVLFAPSVIGEDSGDRMVLDISRLDTGTLGDGSVFYDISDFVRSFSINRGRRNDLERFSTGTAQIVLSNLDRRFDPTYSSSPYYNNILKVSGVVPSIPIIIRAIWGPTVYNLFRGFVDSWNFSYSSAGEGDAIVTVDCSDAFKVLSNAIGGLPSVTSITSVGTTGFDVVTPEKFIEEDGYFKGGVKVVGTGTTAKVRVINDVVQTPVIGTNNQLSGNRINTILDAISWPENLRKIDFGRTRVAPQDASKTVLDLIQEAASAESGAVYVEADGTIVFDERNSIVAEERCITSQATFDGTTTTGKKFVDVSVTYDDDLIYNLFQIDRVSTSATSGNRLIGSTIIISNPESISLYGVKTYSLEIPVSSEYSGEFTYGRSEATNLGLALAAQYANPEFRPDGIVIKPRRDPDNLWPQVLGRRLRDRITVKFRVPGGGNVIQADAFISSISHVGTPDDWTTTYGLASAAFFANFFIIENNNFGVLDKNKLFY